jgi:outer membrane receptor protein involved in Fe transport
MRISLLGVSSLYTQNQLRPFYGRNRYVGLYVEDSWRATPNLTLNYGLRWDRIEPWYEKYNNNITFIPGEQSVVFPTAPVGIVYPGDTGVSRTAAPAGKQGLRSPHRSGLFAPGGRMTPSSARSSGEAGQTSIRAGFGIYYAAIAGESPGTD